MRFSIELEKNAGSMSKAIKTILSGLYTGTTSGLESIGRHPKLTIGLIGGGALGAYGLNKIFDIADRAHDTYNILENERKRGIMNKQIELLSNILSEQKKLNPPVKEQAPLRFIPIKPSLI